MNNNQQSAARQQQNNEKFLVINSLFVNNYDKNVTDPFNFLDIRFKEPEISTKTAIFVERYKLTAADCTLTAIIVNAKKVVRDGKQYYHCTDEDIIKMSLGAFISRKTFARTRKKLIECGIITTTSKYNTRRVKGNLPNRRTWYCINMTLLKKYGVNQWDLFSCARVKSKKVREAYKKAGIQAKSEATLIRKKLETFRIINKKKTNVTSNCRMNKVYYNNNKKLEIFSVKKETFSTKTTYSPYHRLRDFTQERLDREKGIEKPKAAELSYVNHDCVKQIAKKLSCRYDKGYAKLEEKTLDDDLDGALDRMLQTIKRR